jgi:hypothetical protein
VGAGVGSTETTAMQLGGGDEQGTCTQPFRQRAEEEQAEGVQFFHLGPGQSVRQTDRNAAVLLLHKQEQMHLHLRVCLPVKLLHILYALLIFHFPLI